MRFESDYQKQKIWTKFFHYFSNTSLSTKLYTVCYRCEMKADAFTSSQCSNSTQVGRKYTDVASVYMSMTA